MTTIDDIRARLAAFDELFPEIVEPRLDDDEYYVIFDKWNAEIVSISASYLNPVKAMAATKAIFNAPADLRALLDQHDADQARITALEKTVSQESLLIMDITAICQKRGDQIDKLEAALREIKEQTPTKRMESPLTAMDGFWQIGKIARKALEEIDDE